jgi:hypothetical protein
MKNSFAQAFFPEYRGKRLFFRLMFGLGAAFWIFRNRVRPPGTPRVAFPDPFHTQPYSTKNTPFFNCLNGVMRTGWRKSAITAYEVRQGKLIKPYGQNE